MDSNKLQKLRSRTFHHSSTEQDCGEGGKQNAPFLFRPQYNKYLPRAALNPSMASFQSIHTRRGSCPLLIAAVVAWFTISLSRFFISNCAGYSACSAEAISTPSSGASSAFLSVTRMFTPPHFFCAYTSALGVNSVATKRTPPIARPFRYRASSTASIHGAPSTSKGVSVPRPTETLVPSISPTPGSSNAAVRLRILGDGLTHGTPVESSQSPRCQPSIATTVSRAPMPRSEL